MTDDRADPNPYRLPFTREQYVAAMSQVTTKRDAEERAARLFEPQSDLIGVTLMDGEYMLLAILSPEIALQIISTRPRLAAEITRAQKHRDDFIAAWRSANLDGS